MPYNSPFLETVSLLPLSCFPVTLSFSYPVFCPFVTLSFSYSVSCSPFFFLFNLYISLGFP